MDPTRPRKVAIALICVLLVFALWLPAGLAWAQDSGRRVLIVTDQTTAGETHRTQLERMGAKGRSSVTFSFYEENKEIVWGTATLMVVQALIIAYLLVNVARRRRAEQELKRSEEKFRNLAEKSPNMIFINAQGRVVYANARSEEILGFTRAEFYAPGFDFLTLIAPEHREMIRANQARHMEGQDLEPYEYALITKGGDRLEVILTTKLIDYEGRRAILGIATDISERKQAEEERGRLLARIQEQAQLVQQIVDTVPEGVLLLDAEGTIILANPVAEKDLAVMAGAKIGDTLDHLADRSLEELLARPPRGLWHEVETSGRVFEILARPLEEDPASRGWVLVIRDMTREREFQRGIQQQERLAAVGQLAAGIAHDFNNILAAIVLYTQILSQSTNLSQQDKDRLATIDQQAKHATRLIQQILDFSRRAMLERRPLDLASLLGEQVKLLERTLPENIEIDLVHGPGDSVISADPTRIQQAVMNLVLNARDAMPQGGKLCIALDRVQFENDDAVPLPELAGGEWVRVEISDTGGGIPPNVRPHIFEPFFTTKAPGKGSGLGLPQVYGIVRQHEGFIDVESRVGQGTSITLYLPALVARPAEPGRVTEPSTPLSGHGETVLVVEDEEVTRAALVESLEMLNYRVLAAENGQEALDILAHQDDEIALILSDAVMPAMGGISLFKAMRAKGLTMPAVILTGHPLQEDMESLRVQGIITDWLSKPLSIDQLASVVARVLMQNE